MLLLYGFFEGHWLCSPFYLHLIVGVGPVDRVPEQRYQPRFRVYLRHPLCDGRVKQVVGSCLSCYGPLPVLRAQSREAPPIPLGTVVEIFRLVEEVQFLTRGGLYERVTREQVVEEGCPTFLRSNDDEVG